MKPEEAVKKKVKAILDELGAYWFMPVAGQFGRAGIPDIIACYQGEFVAIETKAGNNKTTGLQKREIERIRDNGGIALVINEDNLYLIKERLCSNN